MDAHIQLLLYVHLRVMNVREATLKHTDKSVGLNLSYKDWNQITSHVTFVYKLTCDWAERVPPVCFTPKETTSRCDRTQQQCETMMHQLRKSSHQSFVQSLSLILMTKHSTNFFFEVL